MKKLLLILLCVPLIGLGQTKDELLDLDFLNTPEKEICFLKGYVKILVDKNCNPDFINDLYLQLYGEVIPGMTNREIWEEWLGSTEVRLKEDLGEGSDEIIRKTVIDFVSFYIHADADEGCYDGEEIKEFIYDCIRKSY